MRSREFYKLQQQWYKRLASKGFHDIEGGNEHAHILQQHGGGANTITGLNAVQARSGRPLIGLDSFSRGDEWEELISDQDLNVDYASSATARYIHYAQLITAQEFELCRLGVDARASRMRRAWALHCQSVGEREIAKDCDSSRHEIRKYLALLHLWVLHALDIEHEV